MRFVSATVLLVAAQSFGADIESQVRHGYADSSGVKIHYATMGRGPLVVMIHGFPDFWYTWRDQMAGLSDKYQVAAMDQRGYNLSDKPEGVAQYDMKLLVGDVAAVIKSLGKEKAVIVGHDWGGAVAWQFAMHVPSMTDKLIILNLPHPRGLMRELAKPDSQQAKNSALLTAALDGTWDWVEKDLTIVTVPQAGHFVQQDASEFVTKTMRAWLGIR